LSRLGSKSFAEHAAITGQRLNVPLVIAMQPDEWARWMYCQEASTRAELAAAKLRKELREELEHIRGAGAPDLVAAMAASSDAETVEAEPDQPASPRASTLNILAFVLKVVIRNARKGAQQWLLSFRSKR
jgi:hypothetical protein